MQFWKSLEYLNNSRHELGFYICYVIFPALGSEGVTWFSYITEISPIWKNLRLVPGGLWGILGPLTINFSPGFAMICPLISLHKIGKLPLLLLFNYTLNTTIWWLKTVLFLFWPVSPVHSFSHKGIPHASPLETVHNIHGEMYYSSLN